MKKLLVESKYKFGDNILVAGAISQIPECDITVLTHPEHVDAFINVPNVRRVFNKPHEFQKLIDIAKSLNYEFLQLTPEGYFNKYSPIRFNALPARHLKEVYSYKHIEPKIGFWPTESEQAVADSYVSDRPILAVEAHYTSSQSFMEYDHILELINKFKKTHRILWLCNDKYPEREHLRGVDFDCGSLYTRRELITIAGKADIFFSTFSGIYWGVMGLKNRPKTICTLTSEWLSYIEPLESVTYLTCTKSFSNWLKNA